MLVWLSMDEAAHQTMDTPGSFLDLDALAGVPLRLPLRASARARRLCLRADPARGLVEIVVPDGVGRGEVERFVRRHLPWIRSRLAALPPRIPFEDGCDVPYLGVFHAVRHIPALRGDPHRVDGELRVGGGSEFLPRRVRDYLKAEALRELSARSLVKAAALGAKVTRISVRDPRSRWGSCAADGRLSYSWRLIMAPEPVLDYVVAHEIAHLEEMNHSPRFWACVARLTPHVGRHRDWLKANGAQLLRYG